MTFDMSKIFEYMSAMQKGIRRNDLETAYFFALKIEEFNPIMLWNRLQVIVSEDIGNANPSLPATFEVLRNWYFKELNNGKSSLLYLAHVITLMASGAKSRDSDNIITYVQTRMHYEGDYMKVPDYALDKHTVRGRIMGRGSEHFWTEGVKLDNDQSDSELYKKCLDIVKQYPEVHGYSHENKVKDVWSRLRKNKNNQSLLDSMVD